MAKAKLETSAARKGTAAKGTAAKGTAAKGTAGKKAPAKQRGSAAKSEAARPAPSRKRGGGEQPAVRATAKGAAKRGAREASARPTPRAATTAARGPAAGAGGAAAWLVKSEPAKYAWDQLVADGRTTWDGVRNFEARNNLRAMKEGNLLLYYHSQEGKEIVGVARVTRAAYPDPTSEDGDWSAVDVAPVVPLGRAVALDELRRTPALSGMEMFRRSRLSVTRVTEPELTALLALSGTRLPRRRPPR